MLPDLTPEHALAITTCLVCLLAIVGVAHWLDSRARRRASERISADEDAADALARSYQLYGAPEPGTEPMTVIEWAQRAPNRRTSNAAREHLERLARMRAVRKLRVPAGARPQPPHPVPEPDLVALRADPFKAYSRRAHVLFPAADESPKTPPRPWHIGDNPSERKQ